jgi:hypothetical protein
MADFEGIEKAVRNHMLKTTLSVGSNLGYYLFFTLTLADIPSDAPLGMFDKITEFAH